jgi:antirestriction protein ArdC
MRTDHTERIAELHQQIAAQVADLVESDNWRRMLDAAARFHGYSLNNILAIAIQADRRGFTPTRVAGFSTWRQLGRWVRKGEKGLAILAPCTYRRGPDDSHEDKGTEPQTTRILRGFRIVHVFDVSQTDGEELPDVGPVLLTGDADTALWDGLAAQVAAHGYTLRRGPCPGGANGVTFPAARTVCVRDDVDNRQAVKTLAHELAHLECGHAVDGYEYVACRGRAEVQAESTAYVVLGACGVDTADYTIPYVAGWADGDVGAVLADAETVTRAAHTILDRLGADEQGDGPAGGPALVASGAVPF